MIQWLIRTNEKQSVNSHMAEQYENQVKYFNGHYSLQNGLQRVVAIKHLAEQGLVLHGDDEILESPKNGNFLGILEVISQFYLFLKVHMETKEKESPHIIMHNICDELIDFMGKDVQRAYSYRIGCFQVIFIES
jgi:hypothetical protein